MHYADFAEDEVSFKLDALVDLGPVMLTMPSYSERGSTAGHQGVRRQQMEDDWPESREAGESKRNYGSTMCVGNVADNDNRLANSTRKNILQTRCEMETVNEQTNRSQRT